MVTNIIWTVLQSLATLFLIGSVASLNIVPAKWIVPVSVLLILISALISIRLFKAKKRIGRDIAIALAFLIFVNATGASVALTKLHTSVNKMVNQSNIGPVITNAVSKDESFIVYIQIKGTEPSEQEIETAKKAQEAAKYAGEKENDDSIVDLSQFANMFAVVNPKTNTILTVNTVLGLKKQDDKAAVEKLEELYGIKFNNFIKLDDSFIEQAMEAAMEDINFEEVTSETTSQEFVEMIAKGVWNNAGPLIAAFEKSFATDLSFKNLTGVAKNSIAAGKKPRIENCMVVLGLKNSDEQLTKVSQLITMVMDGKEITSSDIPKQ